MKKIYVIAHTWRDVDLTIEHFFTATKAVKRLSELISGEFGVKANPNDDPNEYLSRYYEWVSEVNDNMCDVNVVLEVISI